MLSSRFRGLGLGFRVLIFGAGISRVGSTHRELNSGNRFWLRLPLGFIVQGL